MTPEVAFRVDASLQIGTGHVMRCLTLADTLQVQGVKSTFICRQHEGHLLPQIERRGHTAIALPVTQYYETEVQQKLVHADWLGAHWMQDAAQTCNALKKKFDWLVVDHYALDIQWEQALCSHYNKLMVIDDLADRVHCCDLLLDQNLGRSAKDYKNLLPQSANTLIGPRYALLRPEFAQWRPYSLKRRAHGKLQNVLITMGGVDQDNATGQVLAALSRCELQKSLQITVVMGPHSPWLDQVKEQAAKMMQTTTVLVEVSNMAQLMSDSDLCIGAAGGTSWERCSLGVPSITLVLAQNQLASALALQNVGAAVVLESHQQVADFMVATQAARFANKVLTKLSHAAAAVTDGRGGAHAADRMVESIHA